MSLPNDDDDENGRRPPWREPMDGDDHNGFYPLKKLGDTTSGINDDDDDDRTTAETSIGSMSFSSDINSVIAGGSQVPAFSGSIPSPTSQPLHSEATVNPEDHVLIRDQRRRQLQQLGIASGAAFALFVYILIPTTLLMSMILFGGVSAAFVSRLLVYLQWEFQHSILEGRGIGDYLPTTWYEVLTSSSLHSILSDPDGIFGVSEHMPYIMLYMVPGLTPEQREEYVNRLSPTHQRLLRNEQGLLGYLHNQNRHHRTTDDDDSNHSGLMRLLMGDERLRQQQEQQQAQHEAPFPRRLELPPTIPEGIEITEPGEQVEGSRRIEPASPATHTESEVHGIPESVSPIVGRAVVLSEQPSPAVGPTSSEAQTASGPTTNASSRPRRPDLVRQSTVRRVAAAEDVVLFDAMASGIANIMGEATQTVRTRARESIQSVLRGPLLRASIGATALGIGIGAYGLFSGTYDAQSLTQPVVQLFTGAVRGLFGGSSSSSSQRTAGTSLPSGSVLVASTLASGTTAVVLGVFGIYQETTSSASKSSSQKDDDDP